MRWSGQNKLWLDASQTIEILALIQCSEMELKWNFPFSWKWKISVIKPTICQMQITLCVPITSLRQTLIYSRVDEWMDERLAFEDRSLHFLTHHNFIIKWMLINWHNLILVLTICDTICHQWSIQEVLCYPFNSLF